MRPGTRVKILSDCFYSDYDDEGRQVNYVPAGTFGTIEEFDSMTMDSIEDQPGKVIVAPDDFDLVIQIPVGEVEPILDSNFGYDDDFEATLSECGMTQSGYCMLAGTEFCDWQCRIDWSDTVDESK